MSKRIQGVFSSVISVVCAIFKLLWNLLSYALIVGGISFAFSKDGKIAERIIQGVSMIALGVGIRFALNDFSRFRHSFLAKFVAFSAYLCLYLALYAVFSEEWLIFIVCAIPGAGLRLAAPYLEQRKIFQQVTERIRASDLEPEIRNSVQVAIECYNICPQKNMLKYIGTLNPEAARSISEYLASQSKKHQ